MLCSTKSRPEDENQEDTQAGIRSLFPNCSHWRAAGRRPKLIGPRNCEGAVPTTTIDPTRPSAGGHPATLSTVSLRMTARFLMREAGEASLGPIPSELRT